MSIDAADVAERLAEVRARIALAGGTDVAVMAVTKTFGLDAVEAAAAAGADSIGENYAQEVVAKLTGHHGHPPVHFIGQLQSNKVRALAPFVDVYETVDRASLASEIAKRAPGAQVLVQVTTTGESGKGGCRPEGVAALVERCRELGLQPIGLMTVGPTDGGAEAARAGFRAVRALLDHLHLAVCSMGMSDDLEVAVQEGSTEVRVGSALFGPRPARAFTS
ncbi:MAG: YggS family pyridoxal phosphate-dependent enzyme [Ilumatobacteraceae bacterium]